MLMKFVDLNRSFVPIGKDEEADLNIGRTSGHRIGGWLDWPDLLEHRRVVLLAEASSGKTEEFLHQAQTLTSQGIAAFFITIEDLADDGFERALAPSDVAAFERWRDGVGEEGWFFLDSVDEARLHHKSLQRALRRFAGEIGTAVERARVHLSCRVSDWKGREDRRAIEELLPAWEQPPPPAPEDPDAALLDPIFKSRGTSPRTTLEDEPERKKGELLVVQLVPLSTEQRRALAKAAGIDRPSEFAEAIERMGLDALAERPGDLLDLVGYWKTNGRFGSLAEMTEHGIARKLAERDSHRADNRDLATDKGREGAERLAAALTLAKSFTLRAPENDPDPALAAGALDPASVLDNWSDAERNALLRRGVFAPATYGRIRFHHRGTLEYLTARWLARLLRSGASAAVWDFVFAERYGVKTLVSSLHAAAAWLALDHPEIRDEIIRREPLVLLRHGDPRSLPLATKEKLLLTYATRHRDGEISDDSLDHRALWMFATPALANAIREAWAINERDDFRTDLLRLIREGAILACLDLVRGAVLDEKRRDYHRSVALEALEACGDAAGMAAAAQWLKGGAAHASTRLGPDFAKILFPRHLTVNELLLVIERSPPPREYTTGGFGYALDELWHACLDDARDRFIAGLADICLTPPFLTEYQRISARHRGLGGHLAAIARDAVQALGDWEAPECLVRFLMVVERSGRQESNGQEERSLQDMVAGNPRLQRRLFWGRRRRGATKPSAWRGFPCPVLAGELLEQAALAYRPQRSGMAFRRSLRPHTRSGPADRLECDCRHSERHRRTCGRNSAAEESGRRHFEAGRGSCWLPRPSNGG